ncbi:hypothetical protein A2W14_05255 [Candidatus Gottesmanbacteria bacterium RBG_16_37_8]|uniref:Phospholipid/glycerol acyltransferase domain-containing protein n=1 Tax=Candidatus Gottesmanbacteria bacterium RBG_16_37_8 TaxID=1798371 RepID=A0A1F5YSM4_9BACT|nr:MAG: hypothetical protein A2W14_05255 [Candidatus Gottesmanbacteria bacterium RBG_16_37_8]
MIDGEVPIQNEESARPSLYLTEITRGLFNSETFGDITINILNKSGRKVRVEGADNIPEGGRYIVAANHFVRVEDTDKMTGSQKMNDLLELMGAINKLIKDKNQNARVIWTPSEIPRPEGLPPDITQGNSAAEVWNWLINDAKFLPINISRKIFLRLFNNSPDIIPVPHTIKGMRAFLDKVDSSISDGNVPAIFPEGEVSRELLKAHDGAAYIAIRKNIPILPISQYDENGTLVVKVGPLIKPPSTEDPMKKTDFTYKIMSSIASRLPEQLRGFYKDSVS